MYSLNEFESDMKAIRPRVFDTWILPVFMAGYAIKSRSMPKAARRILFTSAFYMAMRNYSIYKENFVKIQKILHPSTETV